MTWLKRRRKASLEAKELLWTRLSLDGASNHTYLGEFFAGVCRRVGKVVLLFLHSPYGPAAWNKCRQLETLPIRLCDGGMEKLAASSPENVGDCVVQRRDILVYCMLAPTAWDKMKMN
jgi:hypothetical protein